MLAPRLPWLSKSVIKLLKKILSNYFRWLNKITNYFVFLALHRGHQKISVTRLSLKYPSFANRLENIKSCRDFYSILTRDRRLQAGNNVQLFRKIWHPVDHSCIQHLYPRIFYPSPLVVRKDEKGRHNIWFWIFDRHAQN